MIGSRLTIKGNVFELGGKVAGAIPPLDRPGSIPFEVAWIYPATAGCPAWADMMVVGTRCRINPEILTTPLRLFDCVCRVYQHRQEILALPKEAGLRAVFSGETFVFWPEKIAGLEVVMIDTVQRVEQWKGISV